MPFEAALATHRFGLGARPGEIEAASYKPATWLLDQQQSGADQPVSPDGTPFPTTGALTENFAKLMRERRFAKRNGDREQIQAAMQAFKDFRQNFQNEMVARFALGFSTQKPFAERLVWFWSNHFAAGHQSGAVAFLGDFERAAVRPHIAGSFEDMLVASTTHPAMLLYLSNAQSIGPDSRAGAISGKGLNENLGREIMELHTLGVDGGYTQADVIAMAKLLTGWSFDPRGGTGFRFFPNRHEPGPIMLRGKTYPAGEEGGRAALHDLARDPATAHHIAQKFAAHFLADEPPTSTVDALRNNFLDTGGDLMALSETLLRDNAAFTMPLQKMRPPIAYVTATFRLMGWPRGNGNPQRQVKGAMGAARMMGEFPFSAPSPKGWPDDVASWAGANSILNRIDWARAIGRRLPSGFDAVALGEASLGPLLRPETRTMMQRADSPGEALALLIASPEFQRR